MKIALVVPGGVDRSGESRVIPALLALLKRLALRHEVHVFALYQEDAPAQWTLHGAHVHNIGAGALPTVLRCLIAIGRANRSGGFDVVQAIWSGKAGLIAVLAGKILNRPSLVHVAGGELAALPEIGYGGLLSWRGRVREAWVLRRASLVSAASEPILVQIAAQGRKGQRIPLGVDLQAWPPQQPAPRVPGARLQLIHVASLNRVKDQTTLLRALAVLLAHGVDFHMDLVGEDTLHGFIQAMAQQLALHSRLTFHGFMTQSQMQVLMARAHVNVLSSLHEAGPLVLLEAAVLGVPSVGTAVGHLAEWAPEGALTVEVGDAPGLAAAIERLGGDEALRLKLAGEAQRRALLEDADHTAALFECAYRHAGTA